MDWREGTDGRAVLLKPRRGRAEWGRKVASWLGPKHYRIRLDDVGTLVWKSLDGETPMSEVVERLRVEFGERVEPAETRLEQFLIQMVRARLIEF